MAPEDQAHVPSEHFRAQVERRRKAVPGSAVGDERGDIGERSSLDIRATFLDAPAARKQLATGA